MRGYNKNNILNAFELSPSPQPSPAVEDPAVFVVGAGEGE
jgi:hypothetical protein